MASSRDIFFDREAFVEDELSMFVASPERNNDEEPEGNEEAEGKGKGKGKSAEGKGCGDHTEPYLGKGKSAGGKGKSRGKESARSGPWRGENNVIARDKLGRVRSSENELVGQSVVQSDSQF